MLYREATAMTNSSSLPLETGLSQFVTYLHGRNVSPHTLTAYQTDVRQFLVFIAMTDITITTCDQITKVLLNEYLASLAALGRSGVTRARKLASLREFFRFLVEQEAIAISPAATMSMPRKEKKTRSYLRPDEYAHMLAAAGGNARDYAMLQLFLQTGIRVAEMASLRLSDVDLEGRTLHIHGKGNKERVLDLEKKATQALKNYLQLRPATLDDHIFLNYQGQGISDRGIKKVVSKYIKAAGITKQISCHSLRHTFGTHKARLGVSAFQLKEWLGHSSVLTSQIYVHLGQDAKKLMEATTL